MAAQVVEAVFHRGEEEAGEQEGTSQQGSPNPVSHGIRSIQE